MIIKDTIESLQSQTYHMYYIAFTMWLFKWIYVVWNVIDMQIKLNLKPSHTGKEKSWAWDLIFLLIPCLQNTIVYRDRRRKFWEVNGESTNWCDRAKCEWESRTPPILLFFRTGLELYVKDYKCLTHHPPKSRLKKAINSNQFHHHHQTLGSKIKTTEDTRFDDSKIEFL